MQAIIGWSILLLSLAAIVWIVRLRNPKRLSEWFLVDFDELKIRIEIQSPGQPLLDELHWTEITRICFIAEGFSRSDQIILFTSERPEGVQIPTEARGGNRLWGEILNRKLFDSALAIQAMGSTTRASFYWSPRSRNY